MLQLLWEQDRAGGWSPAQGIMLGSSSAWGTQGMKALLTLGQPQTPITAPCASSLSRAGCTSSCHKINWQLNVLLLLVLSKEMKLFMVLQVTEFVHKGSMWEIIAANPNFLRHLSVEVPCQVVRPGGAAE